MVLRVLVDLPHVELLLARQDVLGGQQAGHHRVILVVVLVHAVAADQVQTGHVLFQPLAKQADAVLVVLVINGIGTALTDHGAVDHVAGRNEAQLDQFLVGQADQRLVGRFPQSVAREAEVFEPQAIKLRIGHQVWRPGLEVLDASDLYRGIVDIDPVVVEAVDIAHDQGHGQEVAIAQGMCRDQHRLGRGGLDAVSQFRDGGRRNHVVAAEGFFLTAGVKRHHGPFSGGLVTPQGLHVHAQPDLPPPFPYLLGRGFPHLARSQFWITEALDQGLGPDPAGLHVRYPLRFHRAAYGAAQGQALDALRGPVGRNFTALHAPDFLGVGLEKDAEQPVPELVGDPILECLRIPDREDAGLEVGHHAEGGLEETQLGQGVHRPQWVVEQLAVIEDARLARPRDQLVAQDVIPQRLDLGGLGEKAVAADIEAEALVVFGPRNTADVHRIPFQHDDVHALGGQPAGSGEAGRAGADTHDPLRVLFLFSHRSASS